MCIACLVNPFDEINKISRIKKEKLDSIKAEAKLIKDTLNQLENSDDKCPVGEEILDDLRQRQYELSRLM